MNGLFLFKKQLSHLYFPLYNLSFPIILGIGFSTEMFTNENRNKFRENGNPSQNCYVSEMEPLTELPSTDDLTSNDVESWLETSSKYHSCEIVDMD